MNILPFYNFTILHLRKLLVHIYLKYIIFEHISDSNQTHHQSSNEEFDASAFPSSADVSLYQSNLTDSDFKSIKEVEQIYPRKILEQSLHEDDLLFESETNRSSGFQSTGNDENNMKTLTVRTSFLQGGCF